MVGISNHVQLVPERLSYKSVRAYVTMQKGIMSCESLSLRNHSSRRLISNEGKAMTAQSYVLHLLR